MVDFLWAKYAPLQAELRDNHTVGDRSWGVEAGLNRILSAEPTDHPPANDDDIERVVSSEQRRERHRAALRRLYLTEDDGPRRNGTAVNSPRGPDPETFLQVRAELKSARAKVTKSDWVLLCAVAVGRDYAEIAAANGGTPGAMRVRVLRLRREIAQVPVAG